MSSWGLGVRWQMQAVWWSGESGGDGWNINKVARYFFSGPANCRTRTGTPRTAEEVFDAQAISLDFFSLLLCIISNVRSAWHRELFLVACLRLCRPASPGQLRLSVFIEQRHLPHPVHACLDSAVTRSPHFALPFILGTYSGPVVFCNSSKRLISGFRILSTHSSSLNTGWLIWKSSAMRKASMLDCLRCSLFSLFPSLSSFFSFSLSSKSGSKSLKRI